MAIRLQSGVNLYLPSDLWNKGRRGNAKVLPIVFIPGHLDVALFSPCCAMTLRQKHYCGSNIAAKARYAFPQENAKCDRSTVVESTTCHHMSQA